jgi:hypothetical protein
MPWAESPAIHRLLNLLPPQFTQTLPPSPSLAGVGKRNGCFCQRSSDRGPIYAQFAGNLAVRLALLMQSRYGLFDT